MNRSTYKRPYRIGERKMIRGKLYEKVEQMAYDGGKVIGYAVRRGKQLTEWKLVSELSK